MSEAGHRRLCELVELVVPAVDAPTRFYCIHRSPGGYAPLEQFATRERAFELASDGTGPRDAGVASAAPAEFEETWLLRRIYPTPQGLDMNALRRKVTSDTRRIQAALTESGDWATVLDTVTARGPSRTEYLGGDGGTYALVDVLPITVTYQNPGD